MSPCLCSHVKEVHHVGGSCMMEGCTCQAFDMGRLAEIEERTKWAITSPPWERLPKDDFGYPILPSYHVRSTGEIKEVVASGMYVTMADWVAHMAMDVPWLCRRLREAMALMRPFAVDPPNDPVRDLTPRPCELCGWPTIGMGAHDHTEGCPKRLIRKWLEEG